MASAQTIQTSEGSLPLPQSVLIDLLASQRAPREEHGSQSRSTSASSGSTPRGGPSAAFDDLTLDFEYPVPAFKFFNPSPMPCKAPPPTPGVEADVDLGCDLALVIKNTFLQLDGPTSLDGLLQHRQIHSCPPGTVAAEPGSQASGGAQEPGSEAPYEPVQTPFPSQVWERTPEPESAAPSPLPQSPPQLMQLVTMALPPPPATWAPIVRTASPAPPPLLAPGEQPMIVRLAETMGVPAMPAMPALGSPELPTVGSMGHRFGTCKPCAFMHTKGCESGADCQFCHLCDKNERKRRQKQKHQAAARQQLLEQQQQQQRLPRRQEPQRPQPQRPQPPLGSEPLRPLPLRVTAFAR
jgi:hypothetical protein